MPIKEDLRSRLFKAMEQARAKLPTRKAAKVFLMEITSRYKQKGGDIENYKPIMELLLDEFYCDAK